MLYHELENINEAEDSKDELNHIPISSPIALFINTLSGDLKVFAIQWDSHQGNDNIQVKIRNKWETKKLTYNTDTKKSGWNNSKRHVNINFGLTLNCFCLTLKPCLKPLTQKVHEK